jgi:choline dehydrogenase
VADYVIVGAGSAGCVLAHRLSADRRCRVVVLEAGGRDRKLEIRIPAAFGKLFRTALDWNYTTAPEPALEYRELYWPRGKVVGGCSSVNAQMWVRGHALDFDGWAAAGAKGWAYGDILHYFRRSEEFARGLNPWRGGSGPMRVEELRNPNPLTRALVRAAAETGIPENWDVNGERHEGVGLTQVTQTNGRRWSAADAYLRPARRRRNLEIVTGAHATRIVFDGTRAVAVEYLAGGRRHVVRAAREVVLAAGAVNSPQLLMLSGVGAAAELRRHGIAVVADVPGVGQNLQDHLATGIVVESRTPVTLAAAESAAHLARWLFLRRGPLTSNVAEALALVRVGAGASAADVELIFAPAAFIEHGFVKVPQHAMTIGVVLLQPRSAGSITLRSVDPVAPPLIQPRYLSDPGGADLRLLVAGMKLARRVFATAPLAEHVGAPIAPERGVESDEALAAYVRTTSQTLYHPVGTCRMGSDPGAVVDPELRVRGVDNLRVADASVMPRIVRGHTNAPTIMIAEKAAAMLLGER